VRKVNDIISAKISELPSLPTVVVELLNSFDNPDIDTASLAKKIALDQSLVAKTLRLANSPFYGLAGRVSSINDAIVILGFRAVRSLVTATAIAGTFSRLTGSGFDHTIFWRHSTRVAIAARIIARQIDCNPESAFTAALLHDIGRLLLAFCFPLEYAAALAYRQQHDCPLIDAEREVLGIDHAAAGEQLAQQWHFPQSIRAAIAGHHAPETINAETLAGVVHIANVLVHSLGLENDSHEMVPPINATVWQRFNFDPAMLVDLLAQIDRATKDDDLAATLVS
jgi:putative nucleotidyltransferase with HDIG domain